MSNAKVPMPKPQSQKLRAVLHRLWETEGEPGEFEDFYFRHMEFVINAYLQRLQARQEAV